LRFVFKKHIKKSDNINLKKYSLYITYVEEDKRAAGGSTILVRDNILHSYVNLNTHQQAVAVRITLDKTITLCSVYIPPISALRLAQLKHLSDQLPTPFIIMGDFNGHDPLWGSTTTTDKGKKLKDFLSQEGSCIFNDGTDTYLHPGNGSYPAVDLTVTGPSPLLDFSWNVPDDLCGSEHYPIILESLNSTLGERPTRY
jgi:endonuclease/exonuclease/phosphatase family metal-dependent hydrolase